MDCYPGRKLPEINTLFLLSLFFVSLLLRVIFLQLFLADNPCQLMYDSNHYHAPAVSLNQGDGFSISGKPYFYRVPGYSWFLATCYNIFGINVHRALLVQLAIASLIPLCVFFLSLTIFPQAILVAQVAACLAALHPGLIIFSGLIMTETWFVLLFTIFLCLFFLALRKNNNFWLLIGAGIFLGFATLMRPVGHYVLVVSGIILALSQWSLARSIKNFSWLLLSFIPVIMPWLLRNYLLTGYVFLHTLAGPHFINHSAIRLVMQHDQISWQQARDKVYSKLAEREKQLKESLGRQLFEIEQCKLAENCAREYMHKNWWQTGKHALENMFKTIFSLYSSELLVIDAHGALPTYEDRRTCWEILKRFLCPQVHNKSIIWVIYYEILYFGLLLLGILGFFVRFWSHQACRNSMIQCFVFVGLFIFLSLSCGFARLRLPIEPILLIFSSYFWIKNIFSKYSLQGNNNVIKFCL